MRVMRQTPRLIGFFRAVRKARLLLLSNLDGKSRRLTPADAQ